MNMFAFDTAYPETAAVFFRVCVCLCALSPVYCAIHHVGTRRQANDVSQSGETTCSGKLCLNCQREPLVTFARGCDSLQRGTEVGHANVYPLLWLYTEISIVLMVYAAVGGLCGVRYGSAMITDAWYRIKRCHYQSRRMNHDLDYGQPNDQT